VLEELTMFARQFIQKNYELELTIPIQRNNRLRTTLGRYVYQKQKNIPLRIELAGFILDYGASTAIIDVLKHECIHYSLHMQGLPCTDGHPYFEAELKKHGVSSTNRTMIGKYYVYTCNSCGNENVTKQKSVVQSPDKYRTSCCNATLIIVGERIYDGTKMTG